MRTKQPENHQSSELDEFRALLGQAIVSRYSEGELLQLRREMHEMAELLIDLYALRRRRAKRTIEPSSRENLTDTVGPVRFQ